MTDRFDKKAEILLPCVTPDSCKLIVDNKHFSDCPAHRRPAVAKALRAAAIDHEKRISDLEGK